MCMNVKSVCVLCVCVCMCVCAYACMCVCMDAQGCVWTHAYSCVRAYACMCMYRCIMYVTCADKNAPAFHHYLVDVTRTARGWRQSPPRADLFCHLRHLVERALNYSISM